jgi:hypothetical protein
VLAAPGIDRQAMLDVLGAQLNLSIIVNGMLGNWTCHFCCNWHNFQHLFILSFHSNAGTQVNDTISAYDLANLLPIADGFLASCCKQICFLRVQLNLNFSSLVTAGTQGVTILHIDYYIKLPQGSCALQNDRGMAYCLTTFLGPNDLCFISPVDFASNIFAMTLQDGLINLLPPEFNLTSAKMDSTAINAKINSKIISVATKLVLDHLFNQLCPGYSKEPHAALDHIRQTYIDANGNSIFSSVYDYYTQILAASQPFMDQEILPVSVCQALIDGLDPCLMAGFHTHFPNYSKSQDCTATHQRKALQEMLQAALHAEMEYYNINAIASKVNGFDN